MENNIRRQMVYQKTDFNHHLVCQLPNIFKCSKCKHNNTIVFQQGITVQNCLFCGNPNCIKKGNYNK